MYIVTRGNEVLELGKDDVLWVGMTVTVFRDYEYARNAIRRTRRYKYSREYNWDQYGKYKIIWVCFE